MRSSNERRRRGSRAGPRGARACAAARRPRRQSPRNTPHPDPPTPTPSLTCPFASLRGKPPPSDLWAVGRPVRTTLRPKRGRRAGAESAAAYINAPPGRKAQPPTLTPHPRRSLADLRHGCDGDERGLLPHPLDVVGGFPLRSITPCRVNVGAAVLLQCPLQPPRCSAPPPPPSAPPQGWG